MQLAGRLQVGAAAARLCEERSVFVGELADRLRAARVDAEDVDHRCDETCVTPATQATADGARRPFESVNLSELISTAARRRPRRRRNCVDSVNGKLLHLRGLCCLSEVVTSFAWRTRRHGRPCPPHLREYPLPRNVRATGKRNARPVGAANVADLARVDCHSGEKRAGFRLQHAARAGARPWRCLLHQRARTARRGPAAAARQLRSARASSWQRRTTAASGSTRGST